MVEQANCYAAASRSIDKANQFIKKYKFTKAFGSYEELFKDSDVDIIYIGTPHDSHAELSIKALESGKHVLCEKPVAINAHQTQKIIKASKTNKRFFMEAFWTRFNPSLRATLELVANGGIGELRYINADFAFHVPFNETDRMMDINHGGGSLLDVGVYPLFLSYLFLGLPQSVLAISNFYANGTDEQTSIILQYKNAQAVLHSSFASPSNMVATLSGDQGRIELNSVWHETQSYSLIKNNHKVEFNLPTKGKGFTFEIEECHACLIKGVVESSLWSHKDSLNLISLTDEVRRQTGMQYPFESTI